MNDTRAGSEQDTTTPVSPPTLRAAGGALMALGLFLLVVTLPRLLYSPRAPEPGLPAAESSPFETYAVGPLLVAIGIVWLGLYVRLGRNGARITTTVLIAVWLLASFDQVIRASDIVEMVIALVMVIGFGAVLVLMYLPASNAHVGLVRRSRREWREAHRLR